MARYVLRDTHSNEEIEADTLKGAKEAAVDWVLAGDWPIESTEETYWVTVWIADEEGEDVATVKVPIEPPEPECTSEEGHDWYEDGLRGNGGGIISWDVCRHCGAKWIVNTWAQDRLTGEQGLTSTRYEEA